MRRASAAALLAACVLARVADLPRVEGGRGGRLEDVDDDGDGTSFGWRRHHPRSHPELLGRPCTLDRADASSLTPAAFVTLYQRPNRPVVLTGLASRNAEFRAMCHRDALLERWGDAAIVLSTANTHSYDKHVKTLRAYAEHHMAPQTLDARGDETLYWFGDNDHDEFGDFFPAFKRASLIGKKYVPESASVAYSFGVGGPLSGVPYHIHGPGWSESIYGRKKWFVSPPMFEPVFNGNETAAKAAMRFKANGNKARFKKTTINDIGGNKKKMKNKRGVDVDKYGNEKKVLTCVVDENEGIYFPDRWVAAKANPALPSWSRRSRPGPP